MKINKKVSEFFADNDCSQKFSSRFEYYAEMVASGGFEFVKCLLQEDLPDTATFYAAMNVNQVVADMTCSYFESERLMKTASRIQHFGYVKPDLPTLDIGCDSGVLLCCLASLNPGAKFIGVDPNEAAISIARDRASDLGLQNVEFVCDTAEHYLANARGARFGLILALCVLSSSNPNFWLNQKVAGRYRELINDFSASLDNDGKLITSERFFYDEEQFGFVRFVSESGFVLDKERSVILKLGRDDRCSFYVFEKGTGPLIQMRTFELMRAV